MVEPPPAVVELVTWLEVEPPLVEALAFAPAEVVVVWVAPEVTPVEPEVDVPLPLEPHPNASSVRPQSRPSGCLTVVPPRTTIIAWRTSRWEGSTNPVIGFNEEGEAPWVLRGEPRGSTRGMRGARREKDGPGYIGQRDQDLE